MPEPTTLQAHSGLRPHGASQEKSQAWPYTVSLSVKDMAFSCRNSSHSRKVQTRAPCILTPGGNTGSFLRRAVQPDDIGERERVIQDTVRTDTANRLTHSAGARAAKCSPRAAASPHSSTNQNSPYVWYKTSK